MNRLLTLVTVLAAATLMSGCSKCSREAPVEPPPMVEPATPPAEGEVAPEAAPTEAPPVVEPAPTEK